MNLKTTFFGRCFILCVLLALYGCNKSASVIEDEAINQPLVASDTPSDGGLPDEPEPELEPEPEEKSLSVVSFKPNSGSSGISITQNLTIQLSGSLGDIDDLIVSVTGPSGDVAGDVSLSGSTVTFDPSADLDYSSNYSVSVTSADPLALDIAAVTWSFTTQKALVVNPPAPGPVPTSIPSDFLFIGNSLTENYGLTKPAGFIHYHLGKMFENQSLPFTETTSILGGATSKKHYNNSKSTEAVASGHEVTILQPSSHEALDYRTDFLNYTGLLVDMARNAGSTPIVYMIWPAKWRPQSIDKMSERYTELEELKQVQILRVGEVHAYIYENYGQAAFDQLYTDSVHTSLAGTWLVSLAFNTYFTGQSAASVNYKPTGISSTLANQIRTAVDAVITNRYLQGQTSASVTIGSPASNSFFYDYNLVDFLGAASDTVDGDITDSIKWESSINGAIGTGASVTTNNLSVGEHTINLSVRGSDGNVVSDSIVLTITASGSSTAPTASDFSRVAQPYPTYTQFYPLSEANVADNAAIDPTRLSVEVAPLGGTLTLDPSTGRADYTPDNGFSGSDSITFRYTDEESQIVDFICTVQVPTL